MFETGMQSGEYQRDEYRGPARRDGWPPQGEEEGPYAESGFGPGEYAYENGESGYGPGEYAYENGESGYGPGEYAYEDGGRGGEYQEGPSYEEEDEDEGEEERFLPALAGLILVVGQVLGGLLGGGGGGGRRRREVQGGYAGEGGWQGEDGEAGESGEADEAFLHEVFAEVLGQETLGQEGESDEAVLSPAQEQEFTERLFEAADEQEFGRILRGIVNTVGRAVQGVRGAAGSPQGQALIEAVKPLARSALPSLGGAIGGALVPGVGGAVGRALGSMAGSLFEGETAGMSAEEEQYEAARHLVRLTASAARHVAAAPPGAPPELVGELGIVRASRYAARPLYRRALRAVSPYARRYYGRRYHGFRRSRPYGRSYSRSWRYRGPRYWGGYRGPRYGRYLPSSPGYPAPQQPPEPAPEPEPGPPPARPGYRWVAVPIGAPAPTSAPEEPAPTPPEPTPPEQPPSQSEYGDATGGRWFRRNGAIVLHGA